MNEHYWVPLLIGLLQCFFIYLICFHLFCLVVVIINGKYLYCFKGTFRFIQLILFCFKIFDTQM